MSARYRAKTYALERRVSAPGDSGAPALTWTAVGTVEAALYPRGTEPVGDAVAGWVSRWVALAPPGVCGVGLSLADGGTRYVVAEVVPAGRRSVLLCEREEAAV